MAIILRLIESIINIIPYKLALKVGSILGLFVYYLDKRHRKLAISNIIKALTTPLPQARDISIKSFQNLGMNIIEFLIHHSKLIQVIGYEYINIDKGNIFILGHFGNWELLGRVAVRKGIKIAAVGREIKNRGVNRYIKERRVNTGIDILDKKGSFKNLLSALKDGKSIAILIDQYAGRRAVFVDFFGIPTSTTHSPVLLALKTGCPIIPVFIIREDKGHRIIVEPPIKIVKTGDISGDIKINTELIVKPLERYVRQYPEQWWWVHRRWRN